MKKLYFLIIAFLAINSAMAQGCLPEGITFTTQEQIDNFQTDYPNCTQIEGYVKIFGPLINNLNGLSNLTSIEGDLLIGKDSVQPTALTSLTGLNNLTSVGGNLTIYDQDILTSIAGLESLNSVGKSFWIGKVTSLEFLNGLENLNEVGELLRIWENDNLEGIGSLINLNSVGEGIMIYSNDSLINLQGLNNISTPNIELGISDNGKLTSLDGLNSLTSLGNLSIGYNNNLLSLGGLSTVTSVTDIYIYSNSKLINLSGLENIESVGDYIGITSNESLVSLEGINLPVINDIYIYANDELLDLSGLNHTTTIQGSLYVSHNNKLTSLSGLENVTVIGDFLWLVFNKSLTNLLGLSNVNSVGGGIQIRMDSSLTSLTGIENIEPESITALSVYQNPLLSTCEVKSICDYLKIQGTTAYIYENASGCNSREEVEAACQLVGIENIIEGNEFSIYPNPSSNRFTIQFTLENEEQVKLLVLNNLGQVVGTIANETLSAGQHEINWNAEGMPAGVYFYNIQIGNRAGTGKLVLMK